MKLKLYIIIALLAIPFSINAQDIIYWSASSVNENWDWESGCTTNSGGNWYWSTSGTGERSRPDCYASFNKIYFDNSTNLIMNLNSTSDFSANQIVFQPGTSDRIINTDSSRSIYFQSNNGNCKIENYVAGTTHTFNVPIIVNSGNNYMEINPVNGYLNFTNTITNNSTNPINISGNQQVTFSENITGAPGITINNTSVVVYSGVSKTYTGTTMINTGSKLKISTNQTLVNIALNGGTLQVDPGITLTITGTYTSTSGTIDNKGTIKFAGGSVTFPGNASVNNGATNTMSGFEVASTGIVTLNSLVRITNNIIVSTGTLLLAGYDLLLNNATLNINAGATFDNGGENQIINEGSGANITISGTFITRDKDGFVGTNTSIPSITPTLNAGNTIEYGLNGDQAVQGLTAPIYNNVTFSGSGIKSLISGNTVNGTITVSGTVVFDSSNFNFGSAGTNITMTGASTYKLAGSGTKPTSTGIYSLGPLSSFEFSGTSATNIRLSAPTINYANIIISGTNVSNSGTTVGIKFQTGGKFIVKSGATFKINSTLGFSGATNTAINTILNGGPTIILESSSTIEYEGASQTITPFSPSYSNLIVSGTGIKTTNAASITINNDLNVTAAQLTIDEDQTFIVSNKVNNSGGILIIENNGSLVQVNDNIVNTGNITFKRTTPKIIRTDYTYWSSPVAGYTLGEVSQNLTLSDKYYSYDSTIENWKQESSATVMNKGIGYIIRGPESPFWAPFNALFIGVPNNGSCSITGITTSKSYLIGNPYPSALDADAFLIANAGVLDGTLYFWTHNTPIGSNVSNPGSGFYAYSGDDYVSYNLTGGTGTSASALSDPNLAVLAGSAYVDKGNKPTSKIASGQGFFASSKNSLLSNTIEFNNAMRVGVNGITGNNSQFFKTKNTNTKTTTVEKNRIWLNLTNTQGSFKQTLIGYITDATNEFDNLYDGISFDGNEFVDFYSVNHQKNLVIQGRSLPFDEDDEVPLGYKTTIEGTFTIAIDQTDGILSNQAAFIEDHLTNTIFDLKSGDYTFKTDSGTFNDRFVLKFTNKTLGNKNIEIVENQIYISNKNNQIKINSTVDTIDTVTVYDLLGKLLFKKVKVNSNELKISNIISSQQTLLVKVSFQNGQSVTKKIIF